jgi:hypothetical protein
MFKEQFGVTYEPGSRVFQSSSKDADSASDRSDDENRRVRSKTGVTFNSGSASSSHDIRRRQVSEEFELPDEFAQQLQHDPMHDPVREFDLGASGNAQQEDEQDFLSAIEEDMILPPETAAEARRRHHSSSYRGPIPLTPAPAKGKSKIGIFSGKPTTSPLFGPDWPDSPPEQWDVWDKIDDPPKMTEPEQSGPYTDCPYQHVPAAPRSPSTSSSQNADSSWTRDFGNLIQEGPRRRRPSDAPRQNWNASDWANDATNNYIDNHGNEQEVAAPPEGWRQGWWDYASDRWSDWHSNKSWWP